MGGSAVDLRLARAISHARTRFGAAAIVTGGVLERRRAERRFATGTSLDAVLGGGMAPGEPLALVGRGSCGKITVALRLAAASQQDGGMVAWIDPSASLDAVAALRAGVDLDRFIVVRPASRDDALLAGAAALRSDGFRLVAFDAGPRSIAGAARAATGLDVDDAAPLVPIVHGSIAALLVIAETRGRRTALPSLVVERVAWDERFGRTSGWTFSVSRGGAHALFHTSAFSPGLTDLGTREQLRVAAG
ncbi:MAG: hypothetical protein ABR525_04350 [Candidatus Limnocylindria bacterium]